MVASEVGTCTGHLNMGRPFLEVMSEEDGSTGAKGGPLMNQPEISVVIVSACEGGREKSWKVLSAHPTTLIQ